MEKNNSRVGPCPTRLLDLSLAIGSSLDPDTVTRDFLNALRALPGCSEAAIWWPSPETPAEHPLHQAASTGRARFLTRDDLAFAGFVDSFDALHGKAGTDDAAIAAMALFPLDRQGMLAIFSTDDAVFEPFRHPVFDTLCQRLAIAWQGATAHTRLNRPPGAPPSPDAALSYDHLARLLRSTPDLVWLKDTEGKYLACSDRYQRFLGLSEDAILGHTDHDFFDAEIADAFRVKDRLVLDSGQPTTYEEWNTFAVDGHAEYLEITKIPLYAPNDELIGVLGVGHDITARKQTEERSRQLASMLRLMCDNVPDMIWAKDLNHNFLFANKALCVDLLNASDVREPLGKSDLFFAERERQRHPETPNWHTFGELCLQSDETVLHHKRPYVFIEFGTIKGRPLCLEIHKSPFVDADGKIIGTVGCARDITERRRIEEELEQYRHHLEEEVDQRTNALLETEIRASNILHSSADGLYGVDLEGRITFINPAACRILGHLEQDVIGKSAHALFNHHHADGSPHAAADCRVHEALRRGETFRSSDLVYWHADGHQVPVMVALHPTSQNGVSSGAVISFVDITEQRAAEEAREKALLVAENLARTKSQFLANMSHEIRTPLNGVLGFAQIGMRTLGDSDKTKNAFEKILSSGNQLLGIVNDILDFSKIEAGKLSISEENVALFELIDHAVELVAERAAAKKLELRVDKSPFLPTNCISDPLRIEQILLNLLSNAIKFTERGRIRLSAERRANWLIFRVRDTGIGIAESELERIFNPFHQSDGSATRRFGGTGLGLAISRHLLDLMGGQIEASSQVGVGSCFEFRIPYVETWQAPARPIITETLPLIRGLQGISVLVVEDDHTSATVLEQSLLEDGATVTVAGNGAEAVALVRAMGRGALDLVLMDIQMPLMDGFEATRQILQLVPELPVIGQSAHVFGEDKANCLAAGMVAYMAKPINFRKLGELIREHLPRH